MDDALRAKCAGIDISVSPNDDHSLADIFSLADGYEEYKNYLTDWEYCGAYYPSNYEEDNFDPPTD